MLVLKSIQFTGEADFINKVMARCEKAAVGMADELGSQIMADTQSKQWKHIPVMDSGAPATKGLESVVELTTDDKIYGWVDKGTKPVSISKPFVFSNGKRFGGMRFRFQGRGLSYASKTDGRTGGDSRGQIGPRVQVDRISNRSIAARKITDRVMREKIKAILAVGQRAFG